MSTEMQAVCLPSELVDFAELVESSMMQAAPGGTLTAGHLLQRLDVLRQRLSVRWCGTPGAFAGYDVLEVDDHLGSAVGWLTLTARMVDAREATHAVELVANLVESGDGAAVRTLVRGTGRTLQLPA
ncbi:hypothetical protein [Nocardioides ultimimeridianus]